MKTKHLIVLAGLAAVAFVAWKHFGPAKPLPGGAVVGRNGQLKNRQVTPDTPWVQPAPQGSSTAGQIAGALAGNADKLAGAGVTIADWFQSSGADAEDYGSDDEG